MALHVANGYIDKLLVVEIHMNALTHKGISKAQELAPLCLSSGYGDCGE